MTSRSTRYGRNVVFDAVELRAPLYGAIGEAARHTINGRRLISHKCPTIGLRNFCDALSSACWASKLHVPSIARGHLHLPIEVENG